MYTTKSREPKTVWNCGEADTLIQNNTGYLTMHVDSAACIFIRLEDRLLPNIGNTSSRVSTVFTRSAITPPKVNRFGEIWSTLSTFPAAGPG